MRLGLVLLLSALLLSACFPKSAIPPGPLSPEQIARAQSRIAGVTEDSLEQGRKLFIAQCGRCHDHPDINAIPMTSWPTILPSMVARARLYSSGQSMLMEFIDEVHE